MPDPSSMPSHAQEIRTGQRFAFGENWARFLQILDDRRIDEAVSSLQRMLQVERLDGLRFLDIGNGSGLFSLAARRLGAKVLSFDYDPQSVACAQELKRRYFPNDADWQIQEGSVLDEGYMQGLGSFDVVYSWGVLHHTGDQWRAIANAEARVGPPGAGSSSRCTTTRVPPPAGGGPSRKLTSACRRPCGGWCWRPVTSACGAHPRSRTSCA